MQRWPAVQSRDVVQALWHLRNAQTRGELQSELIEHPSASPRGAETLELEQADARTTPSTAKSEAARANRLNAILVASDARSAAVKRCDARRDRSRHGRDPLPADGGHVSVAPTPPRPATSGSNGVWLERRKGQEKVRQ